MALPARLQTKKLIGELVLFLLQWNLVGNLAGISWDCFRTHNLTSRPEISGDSRSIFRKRFRNSKNISCQLRSADVPP